ncbi:MAG: hypothetical protein WC503_00315 [Candidatus Shapirobacteria bacterium]
MAKIKVSSFGAYLISWTIKGREVLYQGSELKRTGIPLLFPNFDYGPPLPSHGFGRVSEWKNIKVSEDSCHLQLTENNINPEYRQIYPHKFIVDLKLKAINNQLNYSLEVQNLGDVDMPISPGLHPYWPIEHSQKSSIKLINFPQFNPLLADWNVNPPNDLYNFKNEFIALFPEYKLVIREITNADIKYFNYLQIWSQNENFPDRNFVCFEPVTRPKNGINDNPLQVKPGSTIRLNLQFEIIFH